MTARKSSYSYEVGGGTVPLDSSTYVVRDVDDSLYLALQEGRLCYLLNPRQMGKSSLRVRTMRRLTAAGVHCAYIEPGTIVSGAETTAEQWYLAIAEILAEKLALFSAADFTLFSAADFPAWWTAHSALSPLQKLAKLVDEILLLRVPGRLVIFIEEIDRLIGLPWSDSFFLWVRTCYNRRADDERYRRMTFVLIGVAAPFELIKDPTLSPFNVGTAITLRGFQFAEARAALTPGLTASCADADAALRAILHWTDGQPFLTQKLCHLAAVSPNTLGAGSEAEWIAGLAESGIIERWEEQDFPVHLTTIREHLVQGSGPRASRVFGLYQDLLRGAAPAPDGSAEQMLLRLSGLVIADGGTLRIANPIYRAVFNLEWVAARLAELRPYAADLAAWTAAGAAATDGLLRGAVLTQALDWSRGKSLQDADHRFLAASQTHALEEENKVLAENARILSRAKNRASQLLGIAALILLLALAFTTEWARRATTTAGKLVADAQKEAKAQIQSAQDAEASAEQKITDQKRTLAKMTQESAAIAKESAAVKAKITSANLQLATAEASSQAALAAVFAAQGAALRANRSDPSAASTLLAIESLRRAPGLPAEQILRESLPFLPRFAGRWTAGKDDILGPLSPDGSKFLLYHDEQWHIIETMTGRQQSGMNCEGYGGTFSEDGRRFLCYQDGRLEIDDAETSRTIESLSPAQEALADSLVLTGNYVARSVGLPTQPDAGVEVWRLEDGKQEILVSTKPGARALALAGDARHLVIRDRDGAVSLWSSAQGALTPVPKSEGASAAAFAADGSGFAVATKDRIYFYSLKLDERWSVPTSERSSHLILGSGRPALLAAGGEKGVRIFDAASGGEIIFLPHDSPVASIKFSRQADRLIIISQDRMARVWRTAPWQELARLGFDRDISFSPDGRRLTTIDDSTLAMWAVPDHKNSFRLNTTDEEKWAIRSNGTPTDWWGSATSIPLAIRSPGSGNLLERNEATFSGDGRRLAIKKNVNAVEIMDVASGAVIPSPDGNGLLSKFGLGGNGRCLYGEEILGFTVWALDTGAQFPLPGAKNLRSTALSFDCRMVATSSWDDSGPIEVHDLGTGHVKRLGNLSSAKMAFSKDGKRLAAARDDEVAILDVATGGVGPVLKTSLGLARRTKSLTFSPDGRRLVVGFSNGVALLWQIGAPGTTPLRQPPQDPLTSVAFSSDSRLIATASDEPSVQIWRVQDGKELMRIPHQSAPAFLAAFSPDDKGIEIFDQDGVLTKEPLYANDLLSLACQRLNRTLVAAEWKKYLGLAPYRETCPNLAPPSWPPRNIPSFPLPPS